MSSLQSDLVASGWSVRALGSHLGVVADHDAPGHRVSTTGNESTPCV